MPENALDRTQWRFLADRRVIVESQLSLEIEVLVGEAAAIAAHATADMGPIVYGSAINYHRKEMRKSSRPTSQPKVRT